MLRHTLKPPDILEGPFGKREFWVERNPLFEITLQYTGTLWEPVFFG